MVKLKLVWLIFPEVRRANHWHNVSLRGLCGNMAQRLVVRGEIPSILRVSGSFRKAFSAEKWDGEVFRFPVYSEFLIYCSVF